MLYCGFPLQNKKCACGRDHDDGGAFKRSVSQLSDTLPGHRRSGRNTWHDESGLYWNVALNANCPYYTSTYVQMPWGVRP